MTYLPDLNSYLHQSSLLLQAYPSSRITTKYSLPRKPNPNSKSKRTSKRHTDTDSAATTSLSSAREKREPAATLTLKTFHPETGICLKYRTDKAQEVGRLMTGLGRLAKGDVIEMPSTGAAAGAVSGAATTGDDKMAVDTPPVVPGETHARDKSGTSTPTPAPVSSSHQHQPQAPASSGGAAGGGGGGKKKKGKGKK